MGFFIFFIAPFVLVHGFEAPKGSLVLDPPKSVYKWEVIEFRTVEKHHFELKAPNECQMGKVTSKEKSSVKCQFDQTGTAKVTLNVCDDDKKYCKANELVVEVKEPLPGAAKQELSEALVDMKDQLHDQLLPSFTSGSPDEIKAQSQKLGQPVFLMISTDWCPPCNQSKEYLLSTPEFQEMTKNWIKVYVDGDSKDSRIWAEILPFNSYPTMALLNSNLEEVSRFQSEYTLSEFKQWMERSEKFESGSYSKSVKNVLNRKQGSWLQFFKDLIFLVSSDKKRDEQNYVLEVGIAKGDKELLKQFVEADVPEAFRYSWLQGQKEDLIDGGMNEMDFEKKSLALAGLKPNYVSHLGELCKTDGQCENQTQNFEKRIEALETSTGRTDAEKLGAISDEYYAQMFFFKDLKQEKLAKNAAEKCVGAFEKMILLSKLKYPRYGEQGILACAKTFDLARVDALYRKMMDKYPGDPTFISRYVRFLKDDKKDLKQAKVWAKKAMDLSYDYNWFFAASNKVQIDKALGLDKEARETIQEAFSRMTLNSDPESLDQKMASRFRKLEQTLQ